MASWVIPGQRVLYGSAYGGGHPPGPKSLGSGDMDILWDGEHGGMETR